MPRTKNPNSEGRQVILKAFRADPSASLRELVRATGYSQTTVYYHINNLRDEGVITRENKPRGVYDRSKTKMVYKAKPLIRKESKYQKAMKVERNERKAGLQARIEQVVQAAKKNGTYYGI